MQLKLTWDFNKMKALITASLFIFSIFNLFAQPIIEWQKTIGGTGAEYMSYTETVFPTSDGGYIIGGYSGSSASGHKTESSIGLDYWVVKTDAFGTIEWENTIGGSANDALFSIIQTSDNGYLLGGYSNSGISGDKSEANIGGVDYWIIKLNVSGQIQWQNTIGGTGNDNLRSMVQTNDGGYILGGSSDSGISGDKSEANIGLQDYWVVKLDEFGGIQWENTIGGTDTDVLMSIIQTEDGKFLLGGYSRSSISGDKTEATQGSYDYWVLKLNQSGNIEWQNTIGGNDFDRLHSICKTNDGGYVLGGHSRSQISGDKTESSPYFESSYDYWIIKIDNFGQIIWQNTIGGSELDECYSVNPTNDGGFIIGGKSKSNYFAAGDQIESGLGLDDFWVVKIDSNGTLEWQNKIGGSGDDKLYTVKQTSDSGFILVGTSDSGISSDKTDTVIGSTDYWVIKLAPDCTSSSFIMNELSNITSTCSVSPITPSATDNCGNIHYATSNVSFPIETIGLTVVTWTYSYMNNTATQTQYVYITEPVNQAVSPLSQIICANSPATINVSSSEIGIDYYLRADSNDSVIVGPIAGTGSAINFTVPSISSTTLYNVFAEKSINDALDFNGMNNSVVLPHFSILSGFSEGTIETWINLDALNDEPIFSISSGPGPTYYTAFTIGKYVNENGVLTAGIPGIVYFHSKNGTPTAISNTSLTSGIWHHIAVSFSSTGASIYINGVLDATTLGDFSYPTTGGNYPRIGQMYLSRLDGRLDEFRLWKIQKTESEILSNINNCLVGNEPELKAYYKFNDGIEWGAIVRDASINNYQGTMSNFDLTTAWVPGIENCSSICFKEMDQIASVIVPNIPPTITCPSSQTRNTDFNNCSYTVIGTEFDPSFNDDCPGAYITNSFNGTNSLAGVVFPIGTTTIVWEATDAAGNTSTCSFNVVVEVPVVTNLGATNILPDAATITWDAGAALGFGWYSFRYKQTSSGTWINYGTITGSAISKVISGLSPGTEYEAQIKRHANSQCTSTWSSSVIFTTTSSGCGAPMVFNTPAVGSNSITVTWPAVAGATWYQFQYKESASGTWLSGGTLTGTATSKTFNGLLASTSYNVRGRTYCPNGTASAWSTTATATTGAAAACSLPPVLSISSVTSSTATITWTAVSGAGWYAFEYKESVSGTWLSAGTLAGTGTTKTFTGLAAATTYDVRVRTFCPNVTPSAWSTIVNPTTTSTQACSFPPTLTAATVLATTATITWPSVAGASWFEFRYKETAAGTWLSAGTLTGTGTTKTYTGLIAGTQYDFEAKSFCANGLPSAWSATLQFTTTMAMPLQPKPGSDLANDKALENTNIDVNVYPNPTSDLVNIETIIEEANTSIIVKVIDMNGRIVLEMNTLSVDGKNAIQLSLQNLNVGIYNLELYNNNALLDRSKVIKTN